MLGVTWDVGRVKGVPIKTLEGLVHHVSETLGNEVSGLHMVRAGFVGEKEPHLEATHVETCMWYHIWLRRERGSSGPWYQACKAGL